MSIEEKQTRLVTLMGKAYDKRKRALLIATSDIDVDTKIREYGRALLYTKIIDRLANYYRKLDSTCVS